jgi:hypothetical protein
MASKPTSYKFQFSFSVANCGLTAGPDSASIITNTCPRRDKENPGTAGRRHRAKGKIAMEEIRRSDSVCKHPKIYSLHRGRSRRPLVRVVSDSCGLYRVEWPDIGLSDLANLTRCKAAAREWAERRAILEDRKSNAARRLKSLDKFWWSSSCVAQNLRGAA